MLANSAAAQLTTNPLGIKITSPTKGQQIPSDTNNLRINGFSSHGHLLNCNVYVIVNGIKPYHKALSTTSNTSSNNYSTWVYYLVPSYTSIKIGTNKVTSKLACESSNNTAAANGVPAFTKFYSINFTGISSRGANSSTTSSPIYTNENLILPSHHTNTQAAGIGMTKANDSKVITQSVSRANAGNVVANKNKTLFVSHPSQLENVNAATLLSTAGIASKNQSGLNQNKALSGTPSSTSTHDHLSNPNSPPTLTTSNTNQKSKNPNNTVSQVAQDSSKSKPTIRPKNGNIENPLILSIHLLPHVAQPGGRENMTLGVTDGNKTHAVAGATIVGRIVDSTGISKKLEGVTDNKGKVRYSWPIAGTNTTNGFYRLTMSASAPGYQNNSITKTVQIVPISSISSTLHPTLFGLHTKLNNSTNVQESMPLGPANVPTGSQTGLMPHEPIPLTTNQNSSNLENVKNKVIGKVYIPSGTSGTSSAALPFTNGKVSIPTQSQPVNITSNPRVSVPNTPKTAPNSNPSTQNIGPNQIPQLPNNNDKTPFIIATPILHITNGTSSPSSSHLYGIAAALNIVDRMRFLGIESYKGGLTTKISSLPSATGVTQKNTVFVPSPSQVNIN
jgi:hypothetical protein